jgi:hypothetical protein
MFDNVSVKQANAIDDVTARQLLAAFDLRMILYRFCASAA